MCFVILTQNNDKLKHGNFQIPAFAFQDNNKSLFFYSY